jgi:carbonic anhydrase
MIKVFFLNICLFFIAQYGAFAAISPNDALEKLIAGNKRFYEGKSTHKKWEQEARQKKSASQEPFAIILGCSDSRTPPEILFDQGLGDLFVVRVAGNVVGDIELASIEFAVSHLHSPLIVVLGHQECGAVTAAMQGPSAQSELHEIYPLIDSAITECKQAGTKELVDVIHCNVRHSMQTLKSASALAPFLGNKKLKIVGGYCLPNANTAKIQAISTTKSTPAI